MAMSKKTKAARKAQIRKGYAKARQGTLPLRKAKTVRVKGYERRWPKRRR